MNGRMKTLSAVLAVVALIGLVSGGMTINDVLGAKSYYETIIPAAEERGYELSKEELDEIINAQETELSPEELGKVAGGTSCGWFGATVLITLVASGTVTAVIDNNT